MITAFIVEDEQHCIDRLKRLLKKHKDNIEIVGSSGKKKEAISYLKELKPHLVFMDVELKDGTCFELLNELGTINFEIVFTTAFEKYAVEAFEYSATHYLLKPIEQGKLDSAVVRVLKKSDIRRTDERLENLIHNLDTHGSKDKKIAIPTTKGLSFHKIGELVRIEADGSYCSIVLSSGKRYLVTRPLRYYEELLDDRLFFRTHQSHLVHLAFVDQYVKNQLTFVKLSNGEEIPVSVRRREEFFHLLAQNRQY